MFIKTSGVKKEPKKSYFIFLFHCVNWLNPFVRDIIYIGTDFK
jgi:hypothetical protein